MHLSSLAQKPPVLAVMGFANRSNVKIPDLGNVGLQVLESTLLSLGQFTLADGGKLAYRDWF
ncbi:MAG: hypothetical protein ACP5Q4_00750 [Candidatus Caldatribacteriaceae bacterium]